MSFQPSPQQQDFFKAVAASRDNLILEAVAGAGKTTTLLEACKLLRGRNVGFAAYNRAVANEIGQKARERGLTWVDSNTFHGFGKRAILKVVPKVMVAEKGEKMALMLMDVPTEYQKFVKRIVGLAKQSCLIGPRIDDIREWNQLVAHYSLDGDLEGELTVEQGIAYAQKALNLSNGMWRDIIDFDDMVYLPAVNKNIRPAFVYDVFLVDEAQDTNPARLRMARKLTKNDGRTFFVGDRHQAIYGFTGADNKSMDTIAETFGCRKLPLTVTYRCPKAVVAKAQQYVSHIQAHESAPQGEVKEVSNPTWEREQRQNLTAGDAILCRKTRPLVEEAYALIRAKIPCHVEGKDIGKGLLDITYRWAKVKTVPAFLEKLSEHTERQVKKFLDKKEEAKADNARDQEETMKVLCEGKQTLEQVREDIQALFKDTKAGDAPVDVTLSTVHKSKGREWHYVYVLGFKEFMPLPAAKLAWEIEQEINLIYVAITRAQTVLTLIG